MSSRGWCHMGAEGPWRGDSHTGDGQGHGAGPVGRACQRYFRSGACIVSCSFFKAAVCDFYFDSDLLYFIFLTFLWHSAVALENSLPWSVEPQSTRTSSLAPSLQGEEGRIPRKTGTNLCGSGSFWLWSPRMDGIISRSSRNCWYKQSSLTAAPLASGSQLHKETRPGPQLIISWDQTRSLGCLPILIYHAKIRLPVF